MEQGSGPMGSTAALVRPMRWLALGWVLGLGIVSITLGRWSSSLFGFLAIAWGAHLASAASSSARARACWAVVSGLGVATTVFGVVFWGAGAWSTVPAVALLVLANVTAWSFAASASEHGLGVARRWRILAKLLGPASLLSALGLAYTVVVGTEADRFASGWTTRVGGVEYALPPGAWPIEAIAFLPALALTVWGVVLFVATYRLVDAADEADPAAV